MSRENDGGAAFPHEDMLHRSSTEIIFAENGLSKREYFASRAMIGICHLWVQTRKEVDISDPDPKIVASMSVEMADALIAELSK